MDTNSGEMLPEASRNNKGNMQDPDCSYLNGEYRLDSPVPWKKLNPLQSMCVKECSQNIRSGDVVNRYNRGQSMPVEELGHRSSYVALSSLPPVDKAKMRKMSLEMSNDRHKGLLSHLKKPEPLPIDRMKLSDVALHSIPQPLEETQSSLNSDDEDGARRVEVKEEEEEDDTKQQEEELTQLSMKSKAKMIDHTYPLPSESCYIQPDDPKKYEELLRRGICEDQGTDTDGITVNNKVNHSSQLLELGELTASPPKSILNVSTTPCLPSPRSDDDGKTVGVDTPRSQLRPLNRILQEDANIWADCPSPHIIALRQQSSFPQSPANSPPTTRKRVHHLPPLNPQGD
ncbi:hypothetical protein CAPTEDRAFT_196487 [Capitella teleta]|uniref:Uncharacterized protein n=1 Tax=Capitella teleta TaxID=283909 RepID=R7V4K5_CAPTE|nr:hypothetical protein CAPTEDRAFT_196487 [Capitella teleta]|eukprot:ELU13402.1 hypothetical protein CAPTEDRAFT_196487 [Capitella teleta]